MEARTTKVIRIVVPYRVWFAIGLSTFVVSTIILGLTISHPEPYANLGARYLFYTIGPGEKALTALQADLHAVYAINKDGKDEVWVAGKNLFIAHSSDGGVTWRKATVNATRVPPAYEQPQRAPATSLLKDVFSLVEPQAFAEISSMSQGVGFAEFPAVPHENLVGVGFFDLQTGVAIGAAGGVYSSHDSGDTWQYVGRIHSPLGTVTVDTTCFGLGSEWVSAGGRLVKLTRLQSPPFVRQYDEGELLSFTPTYLFVEGGRMLAIASHGQMYWLNRSDLPPNRNLTGPSWGMENVSSRGIVDVRQQQATRQKLRAFALPTNVGWVVGDRGVVLRSTDAGKTWHLVTRECTFAEAPVATSTTPLLPPWYLLVNAFTAYAFVHVRSLRAKELEVPPKECIAPTGDTDRPLEPDDREARNLMPLAKTLADFLRNDETKPPLTVAITGTWGSGKSSLMNLVRGHLVEAGWRPVWFNAWHHQKEESLLAALLQTIRMQAVPKFWNRGGPSFYARLFGIRLMQHRAPVIALLMLVAFSAGFVIGFPLLVETAQKHDLSATLVDFFPPGAAKVLLLLLSAGSILYSLTKALSAFGVQPAELLSQMSTGAKIKDLKAQTSFRERFASEFEEVTDALNPKRSMLIFIDDLDRCRPENVVDVLEAVNFLISSGDCFVILGMARDKVEPAVGLAFERMAAEMDTPEGSEHASPEQTARARRQDLARQYLDKLINIEVPVPRLSPKQSLEALTRPDEEKPRRRWWRVDVLQLISLALLTTILALLPVSMLFLGIELSTKAYVAHTDHEIEYIRKPAKPKTNDATSVATTQSSPSAISQPLDFAQVSSNQPGQIIPPVKVHDRLMYWPVCVVLLLLFWTLWWLVTSAQEEVIRDSVEFTKALAIWHPVLYEELPTPRALKRFKNRVRFMAMFSRVKGAVIRDHAIVAIAAMRLTSSGSAYDKATTEYAQSFAAEDLNEAKPIFDEFFAGATFN